MSGVLVVANPSSGGADPKTLEVVRSALAPLGPVDLLTPSSLETFADELRPRARNADLVVVAGGDGTLNCTINALHDRLGETLLGLVPLGTGNDLARTLGVPDDPLEAARAIVEGDERHIDVGRARGPDLERLFVNACIGGFPVEMNEAIDADLKRRLGPAAFWVGGAKAAAKLPRTTVWLDGIEVPDCLAAGVGNGRTSGGGLAVWPEATIDDGLLDGCAMAAANHAGAARLAAKLVAGSHAELEDVAMSRGEVITIESEPSMEINVDGELLGLHTPATFEVAGRLRMRL